MLKRTLIALSVTIALIVTVAPMQSVHCILLSAAELVTLDSADTLVATSGEKPDGRGDSFLRALKAPFRAISRLFGRGKKGDHNLQRISEKDIKKFESAPAAHINDARSVTQASPTDNSAANIDTKTVDHLEKGRALLNAGSLNEAIAELSLVSTDSKLSEAHNLMGVAYQLKGLPEMARKSFETSLKINKNNAETLNNLGYLLYCNGDYRGALEWLKKAARLAPNDPRILNNLALTQSQLGKFDDAYKNFARAGGEIKGRLNVANRLELAGRSAEAQKQYEAARLKAEAEQRANPNSQAITVMLEVKNGQVTYASVPNHRAGMEAYEATALRIARERHYPTTKNGSETIVVRVTPLPAS